MIKECVRGHLKSDENVNKYGKCIICCCEHRRIFAEKMRRSKGAKLRIRKDGTPVAKTTFIAPITKAVKVPLPIYSPVNVKSSFSSPPKNHKQWMDLYGFKQNRRFTP